MQGKKLTVTESAVFYLILSLIKRFGGETYVKQGNVAARLGLARETVCRVIKRLKARGLLKARQRSVAWHKGGRRLISSLYRLGANWCDLRSQQRPEQKEKQESWLFEHMQERLKAVSAVDERTALERFRERNARRLQTARGATGTQPIRDLG